MARLTIMRGGEKAAELVARVHIPVDREKLIQRRDSFGHELAKLTWAPGGPELGLGIKRYQNRVPVCCADAGSLVATCLMVGDHLIDIDRTPVTDKNVARGLLLKALQWKGKVSSVIERPLTGEAKHWVQQALTAQTAAPSSVQITVDVKAIANKQRQLLASKATLIAKSILGKTPSTTPSTRRVTIDDKASKEHMIASDDKGRNLRTVKK